MNVAIRPRMTIEQFLAWEERQKERYEFDGVRPVAMTGGTVGHAIIQSNIVRVIGNALVGGPCRVYGSHLKVATGKSIRYPDALVACASIEMTATVETEPMVIFEVLSPSTRAEDLVRKSAEYRATASVQRYVVLEQSEVSATIYSRRGELWVTDRLSGAESLLDMPEIGVVVALSELYAGITIADAGAGPN